MTNKTKVASYVWLSLLVMRTVTADAVLPAAGEILSRIETENNRRHLLLTDYSNSRQYTIENQRFGKRADVAVVVNHRQAAGQSYTVLARSGSTRLNGIIDQVLSSESGESVRPETARSQITAANYGVRLLGTEVAEGRTCYVLELLPRVRTQYLIVGKAWVDSQSYGVVRIEGQFAASLSILLGAPRINEDFIEVQGFWLPGHVRSVTSSVLLGPTQLDILFSNYQLHQD